MPAEARDLSRVGELIRVAAREQLPVVHPENAGHRGRQHRPDRRAVAGHRPRLEERRRRRAGPAGPVGDGTGLSARIAALHARGRMHVGHSMTHASVIGSTFDGRIVREVEVAGRAGIVPAIKGSAWITGVTQVLVDPTDPFPEGYLLSDTWPGDDVQA